MFNQALLQPIMSFFLVMLLGMTITSGLYITAPTTGEVVEGIVEIRGSVPEEGFLSAEVLYAYAQTGKETWFLIKRLDKVVQDDVLAAWDTTTITDGVYHIKLVVTKVGDRRNEVVVENIQVSNYSRAPGQNEMGVNTQTEKRSAAVEIRAPVSTVIEKRSTRLPSNGRKFNERSLLPFLLSVLRCLQLPSIQRYNPVDGDKREYVITQNILQKNLCY